MCARSWLGASLGSAKRSRRRAPTRRPGRRMGSAGEALEYRLLLATVQVAASKDNTLYQSATGNLSNGAGEAFFVGATGTGSIRRGLIAFDVAAAVPAGATITAVDLQLHMSRTLAGSTSVALHRVLNDWGEGASDAFGNEGAGAPAAPGDATWVHTFFNTQLWTNQGGDFATTASASTIVNNVGFYHWTGAGLIADVEGWLEDPASNFGWEILGNETDAGSAKRFDSREAPLAANRPVLTITYTTAEQPSLSVSDVSVTEGDAGTVNADFTVSLSAPSGQTITVHYATADGSAVAPGDYTAVPDTILTFAPGETAKTVSVAVRGDTLDEPDETFTLNLSNPTNATIADGQGTGTITDDDPPPSVTLSLAGSPMAEAGGTATVTATLSVVSGQDVTVNLGFSGTATLTSDYTRSGASILIPAGSLSGSITLTAVQDALDELDETVVVDITGVTNGIEQETQQVTATITDDDPPPSVTLSLSESPMAEAGGAATVTATLSTASGQDVTVDLGFSGSAMLTADYTRSATSIVIPAGSLSGSITLSAVQDTLDEPDETIVVEITGVTNGTEDGTQQVTATITDDDPPPSVTLSLSDSPMAEASGVSTVTATLSVVSGQDVTVNLGFSGTATLTSDYTRSGASILIPAGSLSASLTLTAVQDTLDEADETIVIDISGVTNGTEDGTQQATAVITDDDPPPSVTLSLTGSPMAEAGGAATVTATLSTASGQDVTVDLGFSGTATTDADYTRSGASILVPAGSLSASVTLTAIQDDLDEPDETIVIEITGVTNGTEEGTQQVTAVITDDDQPAAPQLTGFSVQHGSMGRSFIRFVDLAFAESTGLEELVASVDDADPTNDRIRLIGLGLDGASSIPVPLATRLQAVDQVIEADFGPGGITGNPNSELGDGYYEFRLDLDGDGSFETLRRFHRLLGDVDGDQRVTADDINLITLTLGASGSNLNLDVNGDTVVSATDRRLARRAVGRRLTAGLPLDG
jgi:carbon monoxide dehydrogenase subunit G